MAAESTWKAQFSHIQIPSNCIGATWQENGPKDQSHCSSRWLLLLPSPGILQLLSHRTSAGAITLQGQLDSKHCRQPSDCLVGPRLLLGLGDHQVLPLGLAQSSDYRLPLSPSLSAPLLRVPTCSCISFSSYQWRM